MEQADAIGYRFDRENTLPLQRYIDQKIHLYNEAGEVDEDAQVRCIDTKLDPALRTAIQLDRRNNSLNDFRKQISSVEWSIRDK